MRYDYDILGRSSWYILYVFLENGRKKKENDAHSQLLLYCDNVTMLFQIVSLPFNVYKPLVSDPVLTTNTTDPTHGDVISLVCVVTNSPYPVMTGYIDTFYNTIHSSIYNWGHSITLSPAALGVNDGMHVCDYMTFFDFYSGSFNLKRECSSLLGVISSLWLGDTFQAYSFESAIWLSPRFKRIKIR